MATKNLPTATLPQHKIALARHEERGFEQLTKNLVSQNGKPYWCVYSRSNKVETLIAVNKAVEVRAA